MSGRDNMVSEPLIPVVPRIETAMSAAEEERCKAMLDKILAKMDEQGRKMDDMISTLTATTSRLLGAAADLTPSSSSTTVGFATISSWAVAAHPAVNTVDTDTNFATPTKCSTSGSDPNVDDAKVMTMPLLSGGVPTALRVHVERAKASSPRSFAIGELDTVMPPRCSTFCHNSNTGDVDVATVTLLETGESKVVPAPMAPPLEYSPKPFANVKLDNEKFTRCAALCSSHDAGVPMPTEFPSPTLSMFAKLDVALAYSDEESHDWEETETRPRVLLSLMTVADLEATPVVVIPATVMNLDIACDVALINLITVVRLCAECISVEPSTRHEQYVVQQQLFLELGFISGVAQQVLEELFKNGTVVLWPPPLKWAGGNPWPPSSQVKIAGSRAKPWPVARMLFRYRQGNAQLKPSWLLPAKVPSLLFTYKQTGVQWISPWPPPPQGCIVDFMLLDKEQVLRHPCNCNGQVNHYGMMLSKPEQWQRAKYKKLDALSLQINEQKNVNTCLVYHQHIDFNGDRSSAFLAEFSHYTSALLESALNSSMGIILGSTTTLYIFKHLTDKAMRPAQEIKCNNFLRRIGMDITVVPCPTHILILWVHLLLSVELDQQGGRTLRGKLHGRIAVGCSNLIDSCATMPTTFRLVLNAVQYLRDVYLKEAQEWRTDKDERLRNKLVVTLFLVATDYCCRANPHTPGQVHSCMTRCGRTPISPVLRLPRLGSATNKERLAPKLLPGSSKVFNTMSVSLEKNLIGMWNFHEDGRLLPGNFTLQVPWDPDGLPCSGLGSSRISTGGKCHIHLFEEPWAGSTWAMGCGRNWTGLVMQYKRIAAAIQRGIENKATAGSFFPISPLLFLSPDSFL